MLAKLKSIWTAIKADMLDTWHRCKILLIAIAALFFTLEFEKIKTALETYLAGRELKNTNTKSDSLQTKEENLDKQADQLVTDADNVSKTDQPIGLDWNKK
jgi:FtsZ-binding cell division protein ZapB